MIASSEGRPLFATLLPAFLLVVAILLWPQVLGSFVPLAWQIGNLAPYCLLLSVVCLAAALVAWLRRRRIAALAGRTFPTPRHLLYAAGALVLSAGLVLVVAEAALRWSGYPFKTGWTPMEYRISRFDPVLGWSYLPNLVTTQRFGSAGRPVQLAFDENGIRIPAPGARPDPARPTALFAGCSYTFGHGLPYEETFVGRLGADPGFGLQAVNLGVQGYGTDQSLLSLRQLLPRFNTKVVVYTFLLDHVKRNDNADRRFIFPKARFPGTKPRFAVEADGRLEEVSAPRRYEDQADCHLCDLVGLFWAKSGPPPSIELTRALVKEMKEYVESQGAAFVLVLWTNPHRLDSAQLAESLFPGLGAQVVDLGSGAPPDFPQWMIPGETHPDARAHAYAARKIEEKLRELRLIPAS